MRKAQTWLLAKTNTGGSSEADKIGVASCIEQIKACNYFTWPQGSRIFFYDVPEEWRVDFRDGTPFWRLTDPPKGNPPNGKPLSREAELVSRQKISRLRINEYIERGEVSLLTPRFSVPKVIALDKVIDVRVVWNCKINELNATIWALGFMLLTSQDAED